METQKGKMFTQGHAARGEKTRLPQWVQGWLCRHEAEFSPRNWNLSVGEAEAEDPGGITGVRPAAGKGVLHQSLIPGIQEGQNRLPESCPLTSASPPTKQMGK